MSNSTLQGAPGFIGRRFRRRAPLARPRTGSQFRTHRNCTIDIKPVFTEAPILLHATEGQDGTHRNEPGFAARHRIGHVRDQVRRHQQGERSKVCTFVLVRMFRGSLPNLLDPRNVDTLYHRARQSSSSRFCCSPTLSDIDQQIDIVNDPSPTFTPVPVRFRAFPKPMSSWFSHVRRSHSYSIHDIIIAMPLAAHYMQRFAI